MPGGLICEMETFRVIDFFSSVKDSCKDREAALLSHPPVQ